MGSFPNQRVDVTPNPRFGEASSTADSRERGTPDPSVAAQDPNHVLVSPHARPWRPVRPAGIRGQGQQDVSPESLEADRQKIRNALTVTLGILVLIWGVFLIDLQFRLDLNRFGNRPGQAQGLVGILSMPFLHGGLDHIWNNTVSFFTLCSILVYFYGSTGLNVLFWSWLGTGLMLWTSFAPGNHIGLSGVVYALAAFLFASGIMRRNRILMRVALVVVFLYGSIVWGVLPIEVGVSWQGHLSGATVGLVLAIVLRKQGPSPDQMRYEFLENPEEPDGERDGTPETAPSDQEMLSANDLKLRREALIWQGAANIQRVLRPLSSRGIRKPRKGPHVKSRK